MNNLTKVTGISIIVLSAAYAFTTFNATDQSTPVTDNTIAISKTEQPAPPQPELAQISQQPTARQTAANNTQQKRIAPPSIDKPNSENLSAKTEPRKASRTAPPPPLAPGETADARHSQERGHSHEHQTKQTNKNQAAPPQGADL